MCITSALIRLHVSLLSLVSVVQNCWLIDYFVDELIQSWRHFYYKVWQVNHTIIIHILFLFIIALFFSAFGPVVYKFPSPSRIKSLHHFLYFSLDHIIIAILYCHSLISLVFKPFDRTSRIADHRSCLVHSIKAAAMLNMSPGFGLSQKTIELS
jgi:hypothetical protein